MVPPKWISPRIRLKESMLKESAEHIRNSAARGLLEEGYTSEDLDTFRGRKKWRFLIETHRLGIFGEMAFNIYRGLPYKTAFRVAESYYDRGRYDPVYPDACLDAKNDVSGFCRESATINVKTRPRQSYPFFEGLKVYGELKDDIYVAVSERSRGEVRFAHPQYAILGYALKKEVSANKKQKSFFVKIPFLHPICNLNPNDYLHEVTIGDLI